MSDIIFKNIPYTKNELSTGLVKALETTSEEIIPTGVQMVNASYMWDRGITGKDIVVAIIDTGCDTDHPDLKDQIIGGRNFTSDDNGDPNIYEDYNGHGTHVAGTVAAQKNGQGVVGVAPGAKLLILKGLDRRGSGSLEGLISAVNYAIEQNVDIISMSLGTSSEVPQQIGRAHV